jgi:hypothetical protein
MRDAMPAMTPSLRSVWREIAPGVFWLPNCLGREEPAGWMHVHAACYLIVGAERTLLVDTGHPAHWASVAETLDALLGDRPLDYVFPTHTEIPHAGNLARLLAKYPSCVAVGDVRDLHLYEPAFAARLATRAERDEIALGGGSIVRFVHAAIRDLPNTLWAHLAPAGVLFVSDGFMLTHHASPDGEDPLHHPADCLKTTAELSWPPDPERISVLTDRSIYWMRYARAGESVRRMRAALAEHETRLVAPTHCNVVERPGEILDVIAGAWEAISAR